MAKRAGIQLGLSALLALSLASCGAPKDSPSPSESGIGESVKERFRLKGPKVYTHFPVGLGILPDNKNIVVAYADGSVVVADSATGKTLSTFTLGRPRHEDPVPPGKSWKVPWAFSGFDLSPTEPLLAAVDYDGKLQFADALTGRIKMTSARRDDEDMQVLRFSPDGRLIVLATRGPQPVVEVWDVASGKMQFRVSKDSLTKERKTFIVWDAVFSPDKKWLALGTPDGTQIVDTEKREVAERLEGNTMASAFSPNGGHLVTAEAGRWGLRVWEVGSWKLAKTLSVVEGRHETPGSLCFTRSGKHLLVVNSGSVKEPSHIRIYETQGWTETGSFSHPECAYTHIAISRDDNTFAMAAGIRGPAALTLVWDISALGK